jgi:hypothetical protein
LVCLDHDSLLVMWTPRNLKLSTHSTTARYCEWGRAWPPPFPVVHNQLFCLAHIEGKVVVLVPHCQVSSLSVIRHTTICVVGRLNDGVGVVSGHAVVGEHGEQEGLSMYP